MSGATLHFLTAFGEAFIQGRLRSVAQYFAYPQPVYLEGALQVFANAEMMIEALRLYRDSAAAAGTVRLHPRIVAQGVPARGYNSTWVEWDHMDAAGHCLSASQMRLATYQVGAAPIPRIEMVEFTVRAFPKSLEGWAHAAIA